MIRIILKTSDFAAAANVGGVVEDTIESFGVDCTSLETRMREHAKNIKEAKETGRPLWYSESVVGVHVVKP